MNGFAEVSAIEMMEVDGGENWFWQGVSNGLSAASTVFACMGQGGASAACQAGAQVTQAIANAPAQRPFTITENGENVYTITYR